MKTWKVPNREIIDRYNTDGWYAKASFEIFGFSQAYSIRARTEPYTEFDENDFVFIALHGLVAENVCKIAYVTPAGFAKILGVLEEATECFDTDKIFKDYVDGNDYHLKYLQDEAFKANEAIAKLTCDIPGYYRDGTRKPEGLV